MSRRARYSIIAAGAAFIAVVAAFLACKYRLHSYRVYIEAYYQTELALIEKEMQAGREPDASDTLESVEARYRVRDRIGETLAGPEFFEASWSSDGHHGIETLKMMPTGYERYRLVHSGEEYRSHSSYFGGAEDGTKLIVFEGWFPSGWKREYTVAFRRSELDSRMQSKQRVQQNGAANGSQPFRPGTNSTSPAAGSRR